MESLLRSLAKVYTPLKRIQERMMSWVYSKFPYFIREIEYIPEGGFEIIKLYDSREKVPWVKKRFDSLQGYLGIKFWNHEKAGEDYIILHTSHILKGLDLTDLRHIWAFSEEGFLVLLHEYIVKHKHRTIIDMKLNHHDVFKELQTLIPSICVRKNLTPIVLYMLTKKEIAQKEDDVVFTYHDDDIEKHVKKNDEYIME